MKINTKIIFCFLCSLLFSSQLQSQDTLIFKKKTEIFLGNFIKGLSSPSLRCANGKLYVFFKQGSPRLFCINENYQVSELGLPPEIKKENLNDVNIISDKELVFLTYDDIIFLKGKDVIKIFLRKGDDENRTFAYYKDHIVLKELMNHDFYNLKKVYSDSIIRLKLYSVAEKKIVRSITLPFYYKELSWSNHDNFFTHNSNYVLLTSMAKPVYHLISRDLKKVISYTEDAMKDQPGVDKKFLDEKFSEMQLNHDPLNTFNPIFKDYFINSKYTATMGAVFLTDSSFVTSFRFRDTKDTSSYWERLMFYKIHPQNGESSILKTGTCIFPSVHSTNDHPQFLLTKTLASDGKKLYQLKTDFSANTGETKYYLYEYEIR